MQHLIKTQVIEVVTDSSAGAFELQQKMSSLYYRVLLPLIEKTFNRLAPSDRTVYLDTLSVDLGAFTIEALDKSALAIEFEATLLLQVQEAILKQALSGRLENEPLPVARQWLFYMQHGYLPWNTMDTSGDWYNKALEELATDYGSIEALRRLILNDERSLTRISLLHTHEFLVHLAEVLTGKEHANLIKWMQILERTLGNTNTSITQNGDEVKSVQHVWMKVLLHCASVPNAGTKDVVEKAVLASLNKNQLEQLLERPEAKSLLVPFMSFIKHRQVNVEQKPEQKLHQKAIQKRSTESDGSTLPEEGVFVKHAGLVLLHPFLASFFKFLQLTTDGKFNDERAQLKAMILLHFLATGNLQAEEHELIMPKLLCGYPLAEPVVAVELSETEIAECEALLQEVIAQWSILKNTSVEAVRESFLQRRGKLVGASDDKCRLLVEPDSLDVLLDHLPWGLSTVKLPWMKGLLTVDWK